ncbi:nitrous oxide reductase family maturation protein NosD [Salinilacihabitans rarus]|uniref:nitrous oxide reductase family maturation protein NosD n=1 Tax=Salinilacihabitans rarus TaxID=2961596 RepID=UPI0020C8D2E7|nr:nitrous oxide reductase family maturation protein NosD [Salinilacihabitans rarus]
MTEGWFAALAAAALVFSLAGAVVAAGDGGTEDRAVEWRPDVPDVDDAEAPAEDGVATVDGREFDSAQAAVDAADAGETVVLEGRFDERVVVETPGLTLAAAAADGALLDGGGEGTVLVVRAANVTVDGLWIRNSGYDRTEDDAGVRVNGSDATLSNLRLTEVAFGVWIGDTTGVTVAESTVVGREDVDVEERGNGIHLWETEDAELRDNYVTTVRDGIYYSWATDVYATGNVLWDLRYGVHYMYSDGNRLDGNVAFDNDVGFALMVSENLVLEDNVAVRNDGRSAHGILVKDVEDSEIRDNAVVANGDGFYVYNAQDNVVADNLVLENERGVHVTAGSRGELVTGNSFIANDEAAYATTTAQVAWNDSEGGNYWSDARAVDLDGDGTSEIRHRPAGTVERLVYEQPRATAFAESPAFDAVRLAESSFPVVESPGVIDHRPLVEPPHEDWRDYYGDHDH